MSGSHLHAERCRRMWPPRAWRAYRCSVYSRVCGRARRSFWTSIVCAAARSTGDGRRLPHSKLLRLRRVARTTSRNRPRPSSTPAEDHAHAMRTELHAILADTLFDSEELRTDFAVL